MSLLFGFFHETITIFEDNQRRQGRLPSLSGVAEAVSPVGIKRHTRETVGAKGAERRIGDSCRCENVALKPASMRRCARS